LLYAGDARVLITDWFFKGQSNTSLSFSMMLSLKHTVQIRYGTINFWWIIFLPLKNQMGLVKD
jgi:hypothetical protein